MKIDFMEIEYAKEKNGKEKEISKIALLLINPCLTGNLLQIWLWILISIWKSFSQKEIAKGN